MNSHSPGPYIHDLNKLQFSSIQDFFNSCSKFNQLIKQQKKDNLKMKSIKKKIRDKQIPDIFNPVKPVFQKPYNKIEIDSIEKIIDKISEEEYKKSMKYKMKELLHINRINKRNQKNKQKQQNQKFLKLKRKFSKIQTQKNKLAKFNNQNLIFQQINQKIKNLKNNNVKIPPKLIKNYIQFERVKKKFNHQICSIEAIKSYVIQRYISMKKKQKELWISLRGKNLQPCHQKGLRREFSEILGSISKICHLKDEKKELQKCFAF